MTLGIRVAVSAAGGRSVNVLVTVVVAVSLGVVLGTTPGTRVAVSATSGRSVGMRVKVCRRCFAGRRARRDTWHTCCSISDERTIRRLACNRSRRRIAGRHARHVTWHDFGRAGCGVSCGWTIRRCARYSCRCCCA